VQKTGLYDFAWNLRKFQQSSQKTIDCIFETKEIFWKTLRFSSVSDGINVRETRTKDRKAISKHKKNNITALFIYLSVMTYVASYKLFWN
jgi:hypothetical protein